MSEIIEQRPLVSVIIPTYKQKWEVVENALHSVINQSYENIEIILVNDNPEDSFFDGYIRNTLELKIYKNVIYHMNDVNLGGSLSRNVGINLSKGEYVTFLDDDDEYYENKISEQVRFMILNDLDVSFMNLDIYNSKGKLLEKRMHKKLIIDNNENLLKYHLLYNITGTPTFMYKREAILSIKGFRNVSMGQEFFLMYDSIVNKLNIGYLDKTLVRANRNPNGGISFGKNKIIGENNVYNFRLSHKKMFTAKDIRYIKFRHFLVLFYTYIKMKKYMKGLWYVALSFFSSPLNFIKFLANYILVRLKKS